MNNNNGKAHISLECGKSTDGTEKIFCTINIQDASLFGKSAVLDIIGEVVVHDSRPVNGSKKMFTKKFVIIEQITVIELNRSDVKIYSYDGRMISMFVKTRLKVDDKLIFDTTITEEQLLHIGMKPEVFGNPNEMINPHDAFNFKANLKALSPISQLKVRIYMLIAAVFIAFNSYVGFHDQFVVGEREYFYSRINSDGESQSPLAGAAATDAMGGGIIWGLIYMELKKYMRFKFRQLPQRIRRDDTIRVSELIEGVARVELRDIVVRIVACNMECGQYERGEGTKRRTISFKEPIRAVFIYDKQIPLIPANVPVGEYLDDKISFSEMFAALYPPAMVTMNHGISVHWEVQLLHKEFVDQELVGSSELFEYNDFMAG